MTLDLNRYRRAVKPILAKLLVIDAGKDRLSLISSYAIMTECPVIAVAHYVGEIEGYSPELLVKIDKLILFYKIIKLEGVIA